MNAKDLIERRLKLGEESKAILERAATEKRQLTGEEQAAFDKLHSDISGLKRTIDALALQEAEDSAMAESRGRKTETTVATGDALVAQRKQDTDLALRAWLLGPRNARFVTDAMRTACQRLTFDPMIPEIEGRALNIAVPAEGGYAVPDEMMRAYWEKQKTFGAVRAVATIWKTATGAPLPVPILDDTNNKAVIVDEGAAVPLIDPVISQKTLGAYKYSSGAVIVSVEFLQDSYVPIAAWLGTKLGERIARGQNEHFTTGTDVGQPNGIVTAASLGKTAASATAITFDELIDLQHSVDPAYRTGAAFMMHDLVAASIRKIKDSTGGYIWELSAQLGQPDRVLGVPVVINNDMSSTFLTNNRLVIYGQLSNYIIRDTTDVIFARADEIRIMNHQVVFLAFQRSDGDLMDTASVKYLRTL